MEEIQSCNLCGEDFHKPLYSAEDHYSGEIFTLVRCQNCGLIFTNPRPSKEELKEYYPASYYGEGGFRFHPLLEKIVHHFRQNLARRIINSFPEGNRILEIGSGRGTVLAEMRNQGWESIGTEFSDSLAEIVENHLNLQIYTTPSLQECNFPDQWFDVILCYHVIEHLPDPIGTLIEIKRILRTSGLLIIATPNIGGSIARLSKEYWFANDVPRHLFHFTQETLKKMLELVGFKIDYISTMSMEQDIFGFTQSMLNQIGYPFNILYDLIRVPSAKMRKYPKLKIYPVRFILNFSLIFLGIFLSIIGIPVVIISGKIGKGGTIEVWARI